MIKLIALDLDGTLMGPDHLTVSAENRKALKNAHEKGAKISISTGRTLAIIGDICEQVPEIDYIMYSNGAGVIDRKQGKNIYTNLMSWNLAERVLDYLADKEAFYEVYVDGKSYAQQNKGKYFVDGLIPKKFAEALLNQMTIVDDVKSAVYGKEIEKVTIYSEKQEISDEAFNHFSKMNDELYITSSFKGNIDMTKIGVDKGSAIDGMCKALGFTKNEVMAFGDAGNDCPMLEYADYSFAMENGTDECKSSAKFVTKSNAENGVAVAINKYFK